MQAYLEFFASPEFVQTLLDILPSYPFINYHVVNREVRGGCAVQVYTVSELPVYVREMSSHRLCRQVENHHQCGKPTTEQITI